MTQYQQEHGKIIVIRKPATFDPVTAKYIKVEVTDGKNGYASAAEVDIWNINYLAI